MNEDIHSREREKMVEKQIEARGVRDEKVLAAMRKVPRHIFVRDDLMPFAYADEPLPIGEGQTISQPYIVASMTESLELRGGERVLEIGTGSGYQTAVLAEIVRDVFTVELVETLSLKAQNLLRSLGYGNIRFKIGDGTQGWAEHAPFDAVLVTAAPAEIPARLQEQLKDGGRMIIPVGSSIQELVLVTRRGDIFQKKTLYPVRFVPLLSVH
jgi:protein-L-isoaspartate(D-aspartate) O-methyltransferase